MPTYEFTCPQGHDFEKFYRSIGSAPAEVVCPVCGEVAERQLSAGAGLIFKGSGFYITDYGKDGKKDQREAATAKAGDSHSGDSKSGESSSGEAKASGSGESKSAESSGSSSSESKSGTESKSASSGSVAAAPTTAEPAAPKAKPTPPKSTE